MVQDTYKWVLQIYFICSTFVANKKKYFNDKKTKERQIF